MFLDRIHDELDELRGLNLLRAPRVVGAGTVDEKPSLVFCSNDYLGLSAQAELWAHLSTRLSQPAGATGSRLVTGTHPLHLAAEEALAAFVGLEAALLFSSGYAANVGLLQALARRGDLILSDELNHASIIDGCRLSRADVAVYPHRDVQAVERLLSEATERRRILVVTESLFSMEGHLAPLAELRALCDRFGAGLIVDEAHALGVLGPAGTGLCRALDVHPDALVGTLGKSFALGGAFVAGSDAIVRLVLNRARSFVFSTGTSPALASLVPELVTVVAQADERRARVRGHALRVRNALRQLELRVLGEDEVPIIPVVLGSNERVLRASARLLDRGIFVQAIRPPTVAPGSARLRVVPTAGHGEDDIQRLIDGFAALRTEIAA